jgi:2'-hydroxyisoflavone reductase
LTLGADGRATCQDHRTDGTTQEIRHMSETMLVLGGTAFVGRHAVEAALARGYEVTLFTRGQTNPDLFPEAEHVRGDRDGGLDALAGRRWDVVLDSSGYAPRVVRQSTELLAGRVGSYLFVSTLAVYADMTLKGLNEESDLAPPPDPPDDESMMNYGALKVLCEQEVARAFPDRSASFRAHLVVGPHDNSVQLPSLLERIAAGGEIVAPGEPGQAVQWIDARDLAEFMLTAYEHGPTGAFNVAHAPMAIGDVLECAVQVVGSDARLVWCDDRFLTDHAAMPVMAPPLWIPVEGPLAGMSAVDSAKAEAAGLRCRPPRDSLRDTWAWLAERGERPPGPAGGFSPWTAERQRELLDAWHERA